MTVIGRGVAGTYCTFFLLRQIKCNKSKEYWFLVGNKPIKFSMREFCLTTGLSWGPCPSLEYEKKVVAEGDEFVNKVKDWVKKARRKENLRRKDEQTSKPAKKVKRKEGNRERE